VAECMCAVSVLFIVVVAVSHIDVFPALAFDGTPSPDQQDD